MKGYLYIATGRQFIEEAINSAQSLRKVAPQANITLVTDDELNCQVFDHIVIEPSNVQHYKEGLLYKVRNIYKSSPYDETLFLDTDTYICENCESLFELLEFFDLAIAPDPTDPNRPKSPNSLQRIKSCTVYNTGVILFKKNLRNEFLFRSWLNLYQTKLKENNIERENDQTSFMEAWLKSDSKIFVLSHSWNARTPFFITLNESIKIIHGRHKDYTTIQDKLNKPLPSKHRCWLPVHQKCVTKKSGLLYATKTFGYDLKKRLTNFFKRFSKETHS